MRLVAIHFDLLERVFLNPVFDKFPHCYRESEESNGMSFVISDVWLSHTFIKSSFHCTLEGTALKRLGDRSINDRADHRHYIGIRA